LLATDGKLFAARVNVFAARVNLFAARRNLFAARGTFRYDRDKVFGYAA
jgi:hypothetical protein